MSILEDYIKEMEKDVVFDDFTIKDTQMKLPAIKHKWVGRLVRHKQQLHVKEAAYNKLKKRLMKEAKEASTYQISNPALEKVVIKHDTLVEKQEEIEDEKLIIDFLEKGEKLFNGMSFDIKNLVEIMKMETL
tara:strand:+ start:567 stop:962 length:396 start_codon:yes stop_codon:yes gene_type:complete